jgi:hypothetical protein
VTCEADGDGAPEVSEGDGEVVAVTVGLGVSVGLGVLVGLGVEELLGEGLSLGLTEGVGEVSSARARPGMNPTTRTVATRATTTTAAARVRGAVGLIRRSPGGMNKGRNDTSSRPPRLSGQLQPAP